MVRCGMIVSLWTISVWFFSVLWIFCAWLVFAFFLYFDRWCVNIILSILFEIFCGERANWEIYFESETKKVKIQFLFSFCVHLLDHVLLLINSKNFDRYIRKGHRTIDQNSEFGHSNEYEFAEWCRYDQFNVAAPSSRRIAASIFLACRIRTLSADTEMCSVSESRCCKFIL